jgi:dTDP-glucose 4,6-dehydratase/UDP-glucuronate decarboxylase
LTLTITDSSVSVLPGQTASDVVARDLEYCCERLAGVFGDMAGRRVLLTGGAGFLGYYLIQSVLEWNRRAPAADPIALTVVDNYIRGVPAWLEALRDERLHLAAHDVVQPLPEALGAFDYVLHAASIASPTFYRQHPIATMDANVTGLRLLLDRSRLQQDRGHPLRGFLFFSSSEIYGDPEPGAIPTPETYPGRVSSTGPRACYDESKRYGETLCVNFARQYGLPIAMVRPFNNYGPGLKITDRRVIPDLARNVLGGADLVLHSDGSPTRTFCYVADAVVGYYQALAHGRPGEAYNIGADRPEVTIDDLARRMAAAGRDLFGYTGQVVSQPSPDALYLTDNPQRRCPDISKARHELGFSPEVQLDEGLRRTLRWYAQNSDGQAA